MYGCDIIQPGAKCPGGCAVDLFRLPRGHQGAERRGHEPGPREHVSGYLFRAGPRPRAVLDEAGAQELMDDFVMKLRMARHLRTPEYNELFGGDPMWITEAVGGMGEDGRTLVTKNFASACCIRFTIWGASPEPNLTILWSGTAARPRLRHTVPRVSCDTDAIQYENDDLMRPVYGDDYAIACCVSAMRAGEGYAVFRRAGSICQSCCSWPSTADGIEMKNMQVGPRCSTPYEGEYLDYDRVTARVGHVPPLAGGTVCKYHERHPLHAR